MILLNFRNSVIFTFLWRYRLKREEEAYVREGRGLLCFNSPS